MSVAKNNSVLSEQLIEHFSLTADPFEEGVDVFFEGAQRQHNLETLRHMSTFGDMVLVLTGEKGAGKTSLIERFVEVCPGELNVYLADVHSSVVREKKQSVIQVLADAAGLASITGETTRQSFSRLLQHLEENFKKSGLRNVLVFENADTLPKKELQFYFSYFSQLPKESGVVAVFSGLPGLLQVARLSHVEGDEEWLHQIQLKPLAAPEMLEYLQLRLEKVGFKGLLELTESQMQHLVDSGKGLPGRVNRLLSSVVLEPGSLKLPSKASPQAPKRIIAGVFVLLGLSFVVVAYQYGLFSSEVSDDVSVHEVIEHKSGLEVESSEKETDLLVQQRAARLKMLDQALSESLVGSVENKEKVAGGVSKSSLSLEQDEQAKGLSQLSVVEANKDKKSSTKVESKGADNNVQQKAHVVPATKADKVKVDSSAVTGAEQKARLEKKISPTLGQKESSKPFFKTRAWVERQDSQAYSAQILGSYNEQTAIDFARRVSEASSEIFYLQTLHRGKPWFVVFYGVYESKAAAQAAIKNAPKVIASQQPWLRSFDGILKSYP